MYKNLRFLEQENSDNSNQLLTPNKNFNLLSGQWFGPLPLTDKSTKNTFFWTAPLIKLKYKFQVLNYALLSIVFSM